MIFRACVSTCQSFSVNCKICVDLKMFSSTHKSRFWPVEEVFLCAASSISSRCPDIFLLSLSPCCPFISLLPLLSALPLLSRFFPSLQRCYAELTIQIQVSHVRSLKQNCKICRSLRLKQRPVDQRLVIWISLSLFLTHLSSMTVLLFPLKHVRHKFCFLTILCPYFSP